MIGTKLTPEELLGSPLVLGHRYLLLDEDRQPSIVHYTGEIGLGAMFTLDARVNLGRPGHTDIKVIIPIEEPFSTY